MHIHIYIFTYTPFLSTPGKHYLCSNLLSAINYSIPSTVIVIVIVLIRKLTEKVYTIKSGEAGFYNTYFVSCVDQPVSFEVTYQFFLDKSYIFN